MGKPYLDLGEQPLANALLRPPRWADRPIHDILDEKKFPLQVILCETCGLSQLSVVVNPEILYSGYRFRSGQSEEWKLHCEELAADATPEGRYPSGRALDIACNDGTMLKALHSWGWDVVGVDPAPIDPEFPIYGRFWGEETAEELYRTQEKPFDLVIAQNVLGHVDDPIGFLKAIKTVLAEDGRVVVEVPEWTPRAAFDTVYHEHLNYWTNASITIAADRAGLGLERIEVLDIHGGSCRYWLSHYRYARPERPVFYGKEAYADFAQRVEENLDNTLALLMGNCDIMEPPLAWGASAKAAVYLNTLTSHEPRSGHRLPSAIIDDCKEKQGMLLPGVHIPIIGPPDDLSDVDVLWCLSWNNFDSIANKARSRHFKGRFLVTHPEPQLIDA